MEILPAAGEILLLTNDGKGKRVGEKDFPRQGRYGKGVVAWSLTGKTKLVGAVADKPNHLATVHLSKAAPKSTRLDAAGIRKRASTKGDVIVEVKPGEEVVSINVNWMVDKFVEEKTSSSKRKAESGKTKSPKAKVTAKKSAPKKKVAKKPVKTKKVTKTKPAGKPKSKAPAKKRPVTKAKAKKKR
jgi:DNA gyrase/topoisomerase IV subunit A